MGRGAVLVGTACCTPSLGHPSHFPAERPTDHTQAQPCPAAHQGGAPRRPGCSPAGCAPPPAVALRGQGGGSGTECFPLFLQGTSPTRPAGTQARSSADAKPTQPTRQRGAARRSCHSAAGTCAGSVTLMQLMESSAGGGPAAAAACCASSPSPPSPPAAEGPPPERQHWRSSSWAVRDLPASRGAAGGKDAVARAPAEPAGAKPSLPAPPRPACQPLPQRAHLCRAGPTDRWIPPSAPPAAAAARRRPPLPASHGTAAGCLRAGKAGRGSRWANERF